MRPVVGKPRLAAGIMVTGAALAALVLVSLPAGAGEDLHSPPAGSAERKAMLDAVRPRLEGQMRGPVQFVVSDIRTLGLWGFARLEPQRPGGGRIDPADTVFAQDYEFMDGFTTWALVHRTQTGWTLVDAIVGPTDVAHSNWPDQFGAPPELLGF